MKYFEINSVNIELSFVIFHCFLTNYVLSISLKYEKQNKESPSNHLDANLFDKLIHLNSLNNSSQASPELKLSKRNEELPVFVGGSFDFDLTPFAALVNPIMNFIKNSEIMQVEENSLKITKPQRKYNHFYDHKSEENEPLRHQEALLRPRPRPRPRPIYQSYEDLYPEIMEDIYIENKKPKKIKKKKKRPGFESDNGDIDEEEDIANIGEMVLLDLLETGIAGAILNELIGFNKLNKLISPVKVLKHLTLGALTKALIKKTFKAILFRMIPDISYFFKPNLAYILKRIASRRCHNLRKHKLKSDTLLPFVKTVHRLLFPIMPLMLLTSSSKVIDTLSCFFSYALN